MPTSHPADAPNETIPTWNKTINHGSNLCNLMFYIHNSNLDPLVSYSLDPLATLLHQGATRVTLEKHIK